MKIGTDRKQIGRLFAYCYFEMNVLRCCPFVHLFDTPFQNSPYGHLMCSGNMIIKSCAL